MSDPWKTYTEHRIILKLKLTCRRLKVIDVSAKLKDDEQTDLEETVKDAKSWKILLRHSKIFRLVIMLWNANITKNTESSIL